MGKNCQAECSPPGNCQRKCSHIHQPCNFQERPHCQHYQRCEERCGPDHIPWARDHGSFQGWYHHGNRGFHHRRHGHHFEGPHYFEGPHHLHGRFNHHYGGGGHGFRGCRQNNHCEPNYSHAFERRMFHCGGFQRRMHCC